MRIPSCTNSLTASNCRRPFVQNTIQQALGLRSRSAALHASSRCAVTGANGFLGAHVVRTLLARGHEVIALVGADQDTRSLDGTGVEIRDFELHDRAGVRAALEDAETLIHTVATYAF